MYVRKSDLMCFASVNSCSLYCIGIIFCITFIHKGLMKYNKGI